MINFNVPPFTGKEPEYMLQAMQSGKICGDGPFTQRCNTWIEKNAGIHKALLTTSCTHALEMAALLADIRQGDEVILPSFTFVSTANAFVLRGAEIVFVDVRPDTMNLDEGQVALAVTPRTKAVAVVHYAGVACEMDSIDEVARQHQLMVIEDAAQGVMSTYKGRALGALGDFGCYSFHETKNYSMGEGGALLIRDAQYTDRAEIVREKGTDRSRFHRGQVDKYTWMDIGSSYLPSEINAAYLWAQLEAADRINTDRLTLWNRYLALLSGLRDSGRIELPFIPPECEHNAHMFYIKVKDLQERTDLIAYLGERGVMAVFHYIPLHSSPAGRRFGRFFGKDRYTTRESERLLRLPLYYGMREQDQEKVVDHIHAFYS